MHMSVKRINFAEFYGKVIRDGIYEFLDTIDNGTDNIEVTLVTKRNEDGTTNQH